MLSDDDLDVPLHPALRDGDIYLEYHARGPPVVRDVVHRE